MTTSSRLSTAWLTTLAAALAIVAFGVPDRLIAQWTRAAERGRIAAARDELAGVEQVANTFRTVARAVRPGVVQIQADDAETARELDQNDDRRIELLNQAEELRKSGGSAEEERDIARQMRELMAQRLLLLQKRRTGTGSGFLLDERGHILTNNHVVDARSLVRVRLDDERSFEAKIVGIDPKSDLAVLRIDADNLHPLRFGDSDEMEVGDWVLAVGAPFGLSQSVSHGIISAKGRTDIVTRSELMYQDFLQTDAAVNPGNSGGPLVNLRGEVIGVNTAIATDERGENAGVAFTIPSKLASRVARELIEHGAVARGWLGVSLGELSRKDAELLGAKDGGVLVAETYQGAPADRGGVMPDDVIVRIEGERVRGIRQIQGLIANVAPGQPAKVVVLRDGVERELTVNVDRQPDDIRAFSRGSKSLVGRRFERVPVELRTLLPGREPGNLAELAHIRAERRGALVVRLDDATEPSMGLDAGDLIVACNDQPVRTLGDIARAVEKSGTAPLRLKVIEPSGTEREVLIR